MKSILRWTLILLGLTTSLGALAIATVVAQPDMLRPLVQLGMPISGMAKLPLLGNAVLAAAADQISPTDLQTQLADPSQPTVLIDVRTPEEFQRGHLPSALSIPIQQIESGEGLALIRAQLSKRSSAQLITYCHSGTRSHRVLHQLHQLGIVGTNLKGGIVAWREQVDPKMPEPKP
jgi:rhodanese-related sulfurtransferase